MASSSRRRRVGAPSDPKPQYVAITALDPGSCSSGTPDQNETLDRNQMDLISDLPDSLLSSILLLLPTRYAIRTSILSSRWRYVWKLNPPLHFDDSSIKLDPKRSCTIAQAIASIASDHPGPIHSFRTSILTRFSDVDALIENLTPKGIREFNLSFGFKSKLRYQLPLSLLQCKSLCKVSLSSCFFRPSPVLDSSFPNLKELILESCFLWDDLLHCLLKSCTHPCAKLQELTVHEFPHPYVKHIAIEDAPEIKSLILGHLSYFHTRTSVQNGQKLEVLVRRM